jgi:uncharacterized membrane protein (UPF0127 family)
MKIKIGGKEYEVKIAETEEEKETGLQNVQDLPDNEGMLFIYDDIDIQSFWMEDTPLALDIIFINDDYEVISIHNGVPNSENLMTEQDVKFVLELNRGSDVKVGDELEFPDDKESTSKMLVLDENGDTQMELDGGERIFSRPNTKTLIKMANKAYLSKKDSDYKALGTKVFKFLEIQDSNKAEYVQTPNKEE